MLRIAEDRIQWTGSALAMITVLDTVDGIEECSAQSFEDALRQFAVKGPTQIFHEL